MKNIIIIIAAFFSFNMSAQEVSWIPTSEVSGVCEDQTDCENSVLCYSMKYVPEATGNLTSYTTGFFAPCYEGQVNVRSNKSCVINDYSEVHEACASFGKMLLNCSGNTGQLEVTKDEPVILHQICFNMDVNEDITLDADPITGITMSIDLAENEFMTSEPEFELIRVRYLDESPCAEVAVSDHEFTPSLGLQVFPNPTTNVVKVFFKDGGENAQLSISSSDNKRLLSRSITCGQVHEESVSHLTPGTYITIIVGENETLSKKFIVIK